MALVVVVSIALNAPRIFRVTIISSTDADDDQFNGTWPPPYDYNYTALANNFVFKVGLL